MEGSPGQSRLSITALTYTRQPARDLVYTGAMGDNALDIDIAIIGGGSAGLWLLNRLRRAGYGAALFESAALGSNQSIHSQGIVHGGLKYALAGVMGGDAAALADMPGTWRECLAGRGSVDLTGCRIASEHVLLWSGSEMPSRLASMLAGKFLHGGTTRLPPGDYPPPFDTPEFGGQLYRMEDFVLDTASLLACLAEPCGDAIFRINWTSAELRVNAGQATLVLPGATLRPRRLLLCAGAGNADLLRQLGAPSPAMQRRPLTQVLVRHDGLAPLFAHCIGRGASPRLTVSTHLNSAGGNTWYLGGDVATAPGLTDTERVDLARRELAATLPWVDLGGAEWRTVTLDRAEPAQVNGRKPEGAFLEPAQGVGNALVAWPVKLTLCPALGEHLVQRLQREGIEPRDRPDLAPLASLGRPGLAKPCWEGPLQ